VNTNLTGMPMVLPSAVSFKTSFRFPTARWQDYVMVNIDRGTAGCNRYNCSTPWI
jgi:hypothetical protein